MRGNEDAFAGFDLGGNDFVPVRQEARNRIFQAFGPRNFAGLPCRR
jgi:hypothetical protein